MEANWPDFKFTFSNVATFIQISSAARKATLLNVFDINGDGELSFAEARAVINIPADTFNTSVNASRDLSYSFDEFRFFTNVETIGDRAFNSNKLESIIFPPNIKKIGSNAFYFQYNAVVVGNFDKLEELGAAPFFGKYLDINLFKNVKTYTANSFQYMYPRAGKYTLPYITRIFSGMLTNNVGFETVEELVSNLVDLSGCTSLERIDSYGLNLRPLKGDNEVTIILPASINYLENYCMPMNPSAGQSSVTKVIVKVLATTPPILIGSNLVADGIIIDKVEIHVPAASVSAYKAATNWSYFAAKIYPIT